MDRVALRLDRQQALRDAQVPTLTVFIGGREDAATAWRRWLGSNGRDAIALEEGRHLEAIGNLLGSWVRRQIACRQRAFESVAARAHTPIQTLEHARTSGTLRDRHILIDGAHLAQREAEILSAWLDDRVPNLDLSSLAESPWIAPLPGFFIEAHVSAREAFTVAERAPTLPLAIQRTSREELTGEDRVSVLLRSGVIPLDVVEGARQPIAIQTPGVQTSGVQASGVQASGVQMPAVQTLAVQTPGVEMSGTFLRSFEGGTRLVPLLEDAAAASRRAIAPEPGAQRQNQSAEEWSEMARSKAEALLFGALQALPETAGLFELNARLPFDFGPRSAEGDLVSTTERLVIEIDGYFHFRDADAYRRDRKKDRLLQLHHFLVLRFLASDVVEDLRSVVSSVLETLTLRRRGGRY